VGIKGVFLIKTPYLVLFIFLGAIVIGTASALITITLAGDVVIEGDLDMTNGKISNLVTPSVPADAATKGYVDSAPGTDTLALLGCTTDQVARWTGTEWTCNSINFSLGPISIDEAGGGFLSATSLEIVNDKPAIGYYVGGSFGDLKYIQAGDVNGATWNTPVTIESEGNTGMFPSLAIVNGKPAISYNSNTAGELRFVQASDVNGATWNPSVIVDSTDFPGKYTSLAIVNGNPAISYHSDSTSFDLRYVQASDVDGATWNTPVTVDSVDDTGRYTSLAVVNGKPAIGYLDMTNGNLRYVQASDVDGATWNTPVTVDNIGDSADDTTRYISLAVINGKPAIGYQDTVSQDLRYVQASDVDGATWNTPVTVDNIGDSISDTTGWYVSLTVANGKPAMGYYQFTGGDLKYVQANDVDGQSWANPVTVDSLKDTGSSASLKIVNGKPSISYRDITNSELKYAQARDADGTEWTPGLFFD